MTERVIRTDVVCQTVARDGQVIFLFSEYDLAGELQPAYTSNMSLSPSDALVMSTVLADLAFEVDTGLKPAGDVVKAELIERHRTTLMDRLTVVLNSQREKKTTTNRKLAKQLLDICLSEIFN